MALEEKGQYLTDHITPLGLYKLNNRHLGLTSAPRAFQNLFLLALTKWL